MSLNFGALGAAIAIKDDGALDFSDRLSGSLGRVVGNLSGMASGAASAGMALGNMLSKSTRTLTAAVSAIGNFAASPTALTTEFEAMAQAHSVSTRKILGQNGIIGKDLDKLNGQAAGLAMGMKVSDQVAGQAVASFKRFGKELKSVGINSAETGVKLEDGLGISTVALGNHLHTLSTQFKFSDKQLDETTKLLNGVGATMGDIPGQFKNLPQYLELVNDYSSLAARGVRAIGGVDVIKSLTNAQNHLYQLSGDSEMAQKAAFGLEHVLSKSLDQFQNLFAGTEADLHPFVESWSIVGGDIDDAFKSASQGSDAFIMKMAQAVVNLKKQGGNTAEFFTMFEAYMSKAMDPTAAKALVTSLRHVSESQLETMKSSKVMGESLGKTAKDVWRSSMTLQESFDLAMGAGLSTFRGIGRAAAVDFVQKSKQAFDEFNKHAKQVVADGGPLGKLYEKMSEISSIGAKALLPKTLQPMAAVFGALFTSIAPALGALSQLKMVLGGLLGPTLLISAAVAGLGYLLMSNKTKTNTWGDAIEKTWGQISKFVTTQFDKLYKWASKFDWAGFFTRLGKGISAGIPKLLKFASEIQSAIFGGGKSSESVKKAKEVVSKIWEGLKVGFASVDWMSLLKQMGNAWVQGASTMSGFLRSLLSKAVKFLANYDWGGLMTSLGKSLEGAGPTIKAALTAAVPKILEWIDDVRGIIWDGITTIFRNLPDIIKGFYNLLSSALSIIADIFVGVWDGIRDYLMTKFPQAAGTIGTVFDTIKTIVLTAIETMKSYLTGLGNLFKTVGDAIVKLWDELFGHSSVPELFQMGMDKMTEAINGFFAVVQKIGSAIEGVFKNVFDTIKGVFGGSQSASALTEQDMDKSVQAITGSVDKISTYVQKSLLEGVVRAITEGFSIAFKNVFTATDQFVKTEKEVFKDFTKNVGDMFTRMWVGILEETQQAADATSRTIGKALSDLNKMNEALARAKSIDQAISKDTEERKDGQLVRKSGESTDDYIARTINHPDWYFNYYATQFDNGVAAIVAAVASNRSVTGSAGPSAGEVGNTLRTRNPSAFSASLPPAATLPPK